MSFKLPQLNQSRNGDLPNGQSASSGGYSRRKSSRIDSKAPFKAPTDDEVFLYRENERMKQNDQKRKQRTLNIWEKKTASTKQPLRNFRNFGISGANKVEHFFSKFCKSSFIKILEFKNV